MSLEMEEHGPEISDSMKIIKDCSLVLEHGVILKCINCLLKHSFTVLVTTESLTLHVLKFSLKVTIKGKIWKYVLTFNHWLNKAGINLSDHSGFLLEKPSDSTAKKV